MSPLFGDRNDRQRRAGATTMATRGGEGWRFSLKGSPRHYDDVAHIIADSDEAIVYFGEALTYERGAGVALWRIRARDFSWMRKLYDWWANQERIEPIDFTFHLYIPPEEKYPALNLRDHSPDEVIDYIKRHAPQN